MVSSILIIIVIVTLFGTVPVWPYSRRWGYLPSGVSGLMVAILFLMLLFGLF